MRRAVIINPCDNVAVAMQPLSCNEKHFGVVLKSDIAFGHKFAIKAIAKGEDVVKYGFKIGIATEFVAPGEHLHVHNAKTALTETAEYKYNKNYIIPTPRLSATFNGFLRSDGRAGVRNEVWVIPTVGCVNKVAEKLCRDNAGLINESLEGIYSFSHPYGCSQMGEDHATTRKIIAGLANNPNAAAVLFVGLGCENLTREQLEEELGEYDKDRIKFLNCQDEEDEYLIGSNLLLELSLYAKQFKRQPISTDKLVVGLKCGGSDGLSGITANPVVGMFTDALTAQGGSAILTEIPEMFGAEEMLMNRCVDTEIFNKTVKMINSFKNYFTKHEQVVYENPSPGNKQGGITTLEDKSCGCIQKGGSAVINDVVEYGDNIKTSGLNLLYGPGNDLVSTTALTVCGAQIILFTTGRGTPFGAPVPTVKISTNTPLYNKKPGWMDFNAGLVADGVEMQEVAELLFNKVLNIASGEQTKNEQMGFKEIAIFKNGVTL